MSKIAFKSNESGTATFTIEAPATNTNRIFELPDEAGKILTNATPGTVLQVVQGTTTTPVFVSTLNYTDTTLSASITPTSATSKILVLVSQNTGLERTGSDRNTIEYKILRNAVEIYNNPIILSFIGGVNPNNEIRLRGNIFSSVLDDPNTTTSITYKTQGRPTETSAGGRATFQIIDGVSSITLMEIAG